MISYKYPIFPDVVTQRKLAEALDACRWLYNKLLEKMNEAKENCIKLTKYETQNMIPSLKLENPKLNLVYSKALQMVNYTLHSNIAGLSALKRNGYEVGPLRFKGYGWYKTLNYNQSGFKIDQDHSRLHLSKIGDIKIKLASKNRRLHQSCHNQERRQAVVCHCPGRCHDFVGGSLDGIEAS